MITFQIMKPLFRIPFAFSAVLLSMMSCRTVETVATNPNWSIHLDKGGCLDVCKSYSIDIDQNGSYLFNGKMNVQLGKKEGTLDQNALHRLEGLIAETPWQSFDSIYGSPSEDSPRYEITYTADKQRKSIVYYRLEPKELRKIEIIIDSIIEDEKF